MRLELEGVRGLVQRNEGPEAVQWDAQGSRAGRDVRLDEVQAPARHRRGCQQADVVLAQNLASQEADQESELLVADGAVDDARQRLARCLGLSGRLVAQHLDAREERTEGD